MISLFLLLRNWREPIIRSKPFYCCFFNH